MQPIPPPHLTDNEWMTVSVALSDAERGWCEPCRHHRGLVGQIVRLSQLMLNIEPPTPLADPRLEAIRRFICASRTQRSPALELAPDLEAYGFSRAQIEAMGLLSK